MLLIYEVDLLESVAICDDGGKTCGSHDNMKLLDEMKNLYYVILDIPVTLRENTAASGPLVLFRLKHRIDYLMTKSLDN